MAQINLLKQKTSIDSVWQMTTSVLVKLLAVAFLAMLGFYGWQFYKINKIAAQEISDQQEISTAQQSAGAITNREELYTRQAQLSEQSGLIQKHLYWSQLFPALAKVTFKKASYTAIQLTKEGQLTLKVTVPDLYSIDKFFDVYNQPEFNENFYNLRIGSFQKSEGDEKEGYSFDARFDFNTGLLRYETKADKTK